MSKFQQRRYKLRRWITGAAGVRYMADAAFASGVPMSFDKAGFLVAGYDTTFVWSAADWARFSKATEVHIVQRDGVFEGDVLDMESGAATIADVHPWIKARRDAGYFRPTIYCSLSRLPEVRQATAEFRLGIEYDVWVAHWTGVPHQIPGCALTQYVSFAGYDESVVYDAGWPHRKAPVPVPPKPPVPPVPHGPFRHLADGKTSYNAFVSGRGGDGTHIGELTYANDTPQQRVEFLIYLILGGPDTAMPARMPIWTVNP